MIEDEVLQFKTDVLINNSNTSDKCKRDEDRNKIGLYERSLKNVEEKRIILDKMRDKQTENLFNPTLLPVDKKYMDRIKKQNRDPQKNPYKVC
jgi:hypothetical protein